jgi:hypothetical protein
VASLIYDIITRDKTGPGLNKAAANIDRAGKSGFRAAAGVGLLGAKFVGLGAGAAVAAAAVVPAAGAILLLPGAAFAAAAGVGALGLAMSGLGEAFKATGAAAGGGGGGMSIAQRARQIAAAQREVRNAHEGVTAATKDLRRANDELNRSYREASERLEDLNRDYAESLIDVRDAADAVEDAQLRLIEAQQRGTPEDVDDAQRAYEHAVLGLDRVKDRVDDLARERAEESAKGVKGSDEVTAAVERQQDAVRGLRDANERLAEAQLDLAEAGKSPGGGGGIDKAADAMAKLSPAGRELIKTLHDLGPAWSAMRKDVQQATLQGLAKEVRDVSGALLPTLRRRLVEMGAAWNTGFKDVAGLLKSREYVEDVDTALGNAAKGAGFLARSWRPVISGLRHIGVVGSQFLPGIGKSTLTIAERFERWAKAGRETGKIERWIRDGLTTLKQWATVAGNVGGAMAAIYKGGASAAGQGFLAWLVDATGRTKEFLQSAEGQEHIQDFFDTLGRLVRGGAAAWREFTADGTPVFGMLSLIYRVARPLLENFEDWAPTIGHILGVLLPAVVGFKALGLAFGVITKAAGLAAVAVKGFSSAATATPWGAIAAGAYGLGYALAYAADHADVLWPKLGNLTAGVVGLEVPQQKAAKGSKAWASVLGILSSEATRTVVALTLLERKFQDTVTNTLDASRASIGYESALDELDLSIRANGRSLDINTAAGRANQTAILNVVDAAYRLYQANLASGMDPGKAKALYQAQIDKLNEVGGAAFNAKDKLKQITGKYNIDVIVNTKIMGAFAKAIASVLPGWLGQAIQTATAKIQPRAAGGPVRAGQPYLVGEDGPEIVVPDANANVLTNSQSTSLARGTGTAANTAGAMVIRIESGGSKMDDLLVEILRKAIKTRGGNVQVVLGR